MRSRRAHISTAALLPMLALAAYGLLGVFGHSLHGLLPCGDDACRSVQAAAESCSCGHHASTESASADSASTVLGPARDGAEFRGASHDSGSCSLCTLLAKIKVGRLALFHADITVAHSYHELVASSTLLPSDLILSGAPRGPPLA